jgi:hypothetical protein
MIFTSEIYRALVSEREALKKKYEHAATKDSILRP